MFECRLLRLQVYLNLKSKLLKLTHMLCLKTLQTQFHLRLRFHLLCLQSKGDYDGAISMHREALAMKRTIYGEQAAHADVAASLNNIASCHFARGEYENAVEYLSRALAMFRQLLPASHPSIATASAR